MTGVCHFALGVALIGGLVISEGRAEAQYIPDTGHVETADIPAKQFFDEAYEDARWRLGALAIEPFLGVRDASFVSEQDPTLPGGETTTDFTVTVGAGLRAYGRPGPKLTIAAHAMPEYVWWQDDDSRSQLNGRYGLGVFGHLNRLRFEASFRSVEQQSYFSSELPILTSIEREVGKLAVEVDVAPGIEVFAAARDEQIASSSENADLFARLDRSEQRLVAGVRLESRRGFWADVAFEDSTTDFEDSSRKLSNEGTTVGVGVGFERTRWSGFTRLAFRQIDPTGDSVFQPFDDVTGDVQLLWQPRSSLGLVAFGQRGQSYSIDETQSYFIGDRYGLTFRLALGSGYFQVTAATGQDDYESPLVAIDRLDDVQELTAQVAFPIGDLLVVALQGRQAEYDSNLPGFDRDVTSYGLNVRLGRIADKLRLGDPGGAW